MSCIVNPDGTIWCPDGLEDTLSKASAPKTEPPIPYVMGARVTAELLGPRSGMNVILLSDQEAGKLLGLLKP